MILCTGCGTRNPDHARVCATCGRKLQSRHVAPPQPPEGSDGASGQGAGAEGKSFWRELPHLEMRFDAKAADIVRACAEAWTYALVLIAGAVVTTLAEDWRYLAASIVAAAGLAWLRKI